MKPSTCIAALLLLGATVATSIPACTNSAVASFCEEKCACEHCNDDDLDACEASYSGETEAAGEYDCETEYTEMLACQAEEGRCDGTGDARRFGVIDDCADEIDDYADCVDDASDLNDTTSSASVASSAASGGGTGNVAACNNFVDSVMCGTVDAGTYINCSQYEAHPCDISGYFNCLSSHTTCTNGVLDTSGWAQCATQAQCN
jgi:hypothetical protein